MNLDELLSAGWSSHSCSISVTGIAHKARTSVHFFFALSRQPVLQFKPGNTAEVLDIVGDQNQSVSTGYASN